MYHTGNIPGIDLLQRDAVFAGDIGDGGGTWLQLQLRRALRYFAVAFPCRLRGLLRFCQPGDPEGKAV
jgi:hypothetical protein